MARRRLAVAIPALLICLAFYAYGIEPSWLSVRTVTVRDDTFASVLGKRKAVFLSDLHFHRSESTVAGAALEQIRQIRPDLILLAGDYVRWDADPAVYEKALDFLNRLEAPLGVYAVLGDADATDSRASCRFCHEPGTTRPTKSHKVNFLRNRRVDLDVDGRRLSIAGVRCEPEVVGTRVPDGLLDLITPTLLISQTSLAYGEVPETAPVLTLAGDTHGGQVRLPGIFWRLTGRKPDPAHIYGYFRDGRKSLYVTSGIGTSWPHIRLGRRPEIVVLKFLPTTDRAGEGRKE